MVLVRMNVPVCAGRSCCVCVWEGTLRPGSGRQDPDGRRRDYTLQRPKVGQGADPCSVCIEQGFPATVGTWDRSMSPFS